MQTFLESELSQEFCQHLFLSFSSKVPKPSPSSSDRPKVPGESATTNTLTNEQAKHLVKEEDVGEVIVNINLDGDQPIVLAGTFIVLYRVTLV